MNHDNVFTVCTIIGLSLALAVGATSAQSAGLALQPVVIPGSEFVEFAGAGVTEANNELFLYALTQDGWQQIPFQIDEIGTQGDTLSGYFVPDDGFLDDDDELSFMANDGGRRAEGVWITDEASKAFPRYEIAVENAADPGMMKWVYLYRSDMSAPASSVDYVSYSAGPSGSAGADTVSGQTYKMANAANNGFPNFLSFSGADIDILEKQEITIKVSIFTLNETSNFKFVDVQAKDGVIRVVREMTMDIAMPFGLPTPDSFKGLSFPLFYYGNSLEISANFSIPDSLPLNLEINLLRQSFNFNQNAVGMQFFSKNNSGITIDGASDTINDDVTPYPQETTWLTFTGANGNLVNLYKIPGIGDKQKLFYEDDAGNGEYGNTGFLLEGQGAGRITGSAPLGLTSYFPAEIAPGEEAAIGLTLAGVINTQQTPQTFEEVTSVELVDDGRVPESFALRQNYPNPFNPSTQIIYSIPRVSGPAAKTILTVYNLLGQPVRTLVSEAQGAGTYAATWNGRNDAGEAVATGVYIYRLSSGSFLQTQKMLLMK